MRRLREGISTISSILSNIGVNEADIGDFDHYIGVFTEYIGVFSNISVFDIIQPISPLIIVAN
ncbi:hypothetical protein [Oceanobacillus chungangensis]|uniref:hypothetical protein n=1 Tax=Oceanobacillus chungangensis TaxID=1229152 RepID=UPI0011C04433|nr:hypothetical protein [Oceanobacillus chungangensis]